MGGTAKSGTLVVFLTIVAAHLTTPSRASAMPAPSPAPRAATITASSLAKASAVVDETSGKHYVLIAAINTKKVKAYFCPALIASLKNTANLSLK